MKPELRLTVRLCSWQTRSPAGALSKQTLLNMAENGVFDACSVPGKPGIEPYQGRQLERPEKWISDLKGRVCVLRTAVVIKHGSSLSWYAFFSLDPPPPGR